MQANSHKTHKSLGNTKTHRTKSNKCVTCHGQTLDTHTNSKENNQKDNYEHKSTQPVMVTKREAKTHTTTQRTKL